MKPALGDADGRGSRRRYSYSNLFEVAFAAEMLGHGITFAVIESAMDEIKNIVRAGRFDGFFRIDRSFDPELGGHYRDWGYTRKEQISADTIFRDKGGMLPISTVAISIENMKRFIDAQIQKLG